MTNSNNIELMEVIIILVVVMSIILLLFVGLSITDIKYTVIKTEGDSMEPTIPDKSLVIMETYHSSRDISDNEIVAYNTENETILHRIVNSKTEYDGSYNRGLFTHLPSYEETLGETVYSLHGDNNSNIDPYIITDEQIKYTYILHIPRIIYMSWFIVYSILAVATISLFIKYIHKTDTN